MTSSSKPHKSHNLTVGLIVEGESAIATIPQLLQHIDLKISGPIKFGGQPCECSDVVFEEFVRHKIVPAARAMVLKNVSLVVVVIDREYREKCPGKFAEDIQRIILDTMQVRYSYTGSPPVSVVCADRMLENWLIADPKGILAHNYIVKDLSSKVGTISDGKDGLTLLKEAYAPGRSYHKRMDAPKLACKVRVLERDVRIRSPSLDKLLRTCGLSPLKGLKRS